MKRTVINGCIILLLMSCLCETGNTQQANQFGAGYFQNKYLFNPAMAGAEKGKGNAVVGYKKQGNNSGKSNNLFLTGDYGLSESVGTGVQVLYDKAGLLATYKVMATYAYHIKLNDEGDRLSFGLSAGGYKERLNTYDIVGDRNDQALYNFNQRKFSFEADFGMRFTEGRFTLQAAAPNLVSSFDKKQVNAVNSVVYFGAISYQLKKNENEISFEPMIAIRGIRDLQSVVDIGANATVLNNRLNVYAFYHSTKNISGGLGLKFTDAIQVSFNYTSTPANLKAISQNALEASIKFML